MTLYKWDRVANNDATADSTINWAEGQPPSSINDSARGMMAATAKYRDDIAGAIVTGGTSTAYTVSSYEVFDTLAHLHGQVIAFTPHVTNGGACVLNLDGLGNKPIRSAPNVELPSGTLIQGTPYSVVYNNTDGSFYVRGLYGNPYSIPIGATIEYWLPTAPNSAFVFPFGQAISRTVYSTLFAAVGASFGAGDGSTTFNIPDLRGRTTACPDNMGGGTDPNRLTSGALAAVRNSVGGAGGESGHTLTVAEMPAHAHTTNVSDPGHTHSSNFAASQVAGFFGGTDLGGSPNTALNNLGSLVISSATTGISVSINNNGGGGTHNIMQPTILCNRIMRII